MLVMPSRFVRRVLILLSLSLCASIAAASVVEDSTGGTVTTPGRGARVEFWGDDAARVIRAAEGPLPEIGSLVVIAKPAQTAWTFAEAADHVLRSSAKLVIRGDTVDGAVHFLDIQR